MSTPRQEREIEKERAEKKAQMEEMERHKAWEQGRETRVDGWKGFKGDEKEKARPVVRSRPVIACFVRTLPRRLAPWMMPRHVARCVVFAME